MVSNEPFDDQKKGSIVRKESFARHGSFSRTAGGTANKSMLDKALEGVAIEMETSNGNNNNTNTNNNSNMNPNATSKAGSVDNSVIAQHMPDPDEIFSEDEGSNTSETRRREPTTNDEDDENRGWFEIRPWVLNVTVIVILVVAVCVVGVITSWEMVYLGVTALVVAVVAVMWKSWATGKAHSKRQQAKRQKKQAKANVMKKYASLLQLAKKKEEVLIMAMQKLDNESMVRADQATNCIVRGHLHSKIESYLNNPIGRFALVTGIRGSGKTTLVEAVMRNRRGVLQLNKYVFTKSDIPALTFNGLVLETLGVALPTGYDFHDFVRDLNERCIERFGTNLTIHATVDMQVASYNTATDAEMFADKLSAFGRSYTLDRFLCPVIIESNLPQVSDWLQQKMGSHCKRIFVPRLTLQELRLAALLKMGRKYLTILYANNDEVLNIWYYKLGLGLNDLEGTLDRATGRVLKDDAARIDLTLNEIEEKFGDNVAELQTLYEDIPESTKTRFGITEAKFTSYLKRLAYSGPGGAYSLNAEDRALKKYLLLRPPQETVIHLKGERVALWHISHVYYLLSEFGKKTFFQVVKRMNELGWAVTLTESPHLLEAHEDLKEGAFVKV